MKRIILSVGILLMLTTEGQAFPAGTYECSFIGGKGVYVLKPNGRAKTTVTPMMALPEVERGNWQDDDDAAIIIRNDQIIEKQGNKYLYNGTFPCKKVK